MWYYIITERGTKHNPEILEYIALENSTSILLEDLFMNSTKNIDYVKKINTLGKVSKIILIIMRIACIVGIVLTIVGGIVVLATFPTGSTAITGTFFILSFEQMKRQPNSIPAIIVITAAEIIIAMSIEISSEPYGNTAQSAPDGFARNLLTYFPSSCTETP